MVIEISAISKPDDVECYTQVPPKNDHFFLLCLIGVIPLLKEEANPTAVIC